MEMNAALTPMKAPENEGKDGQRWEIYVYTEQRGRHTDESYNEPTLTMSNDSPCLSPHPAPCYYAVRIPQRGFNFVVPPYSTVPV